MHIEHGNPPPLELSRETWRRVFAGLAMVAYPHDDKSNSDEIAEWAVDDADALLARLEETAKDNPHA